MTSNRSTLPYMRYLLDPITGPYPSDNAGRTCLLWLGGPRRPAGLRGQPRGRERGGPLASLPTRRCGAVCWASGGSESDFAAGETLNRSSGPPRGSRSPESTAGCQSKCLVKAQSVSIPSLIAWFESCPLTSTQLTRHHKRVLTLEPSARRDIGQLKAFGDGSRRGWNGIDRAVSPTKVQSCGWYPAHIIRSQLMRSASTSK